MKKVVDRFISYLLQEYSCLRATSLSTNQRLLLATDGIISDAATVLEASMKDLRTSFNEYSKSKGKIPYINEIIDTSTLTKEDFERFFNKKYRERRRTIEESWKNPGRILENVIIEQLLPLEEERGNYQ